MAAVMSYLLERSSECLRQQVRSKRAASELVAFDAPDVILLRCR